MNKKPSLNKFFNYIVIIFFLFSVSVKCVECPYLSPISQVMFENLFIPLIVGPLLSFSANRVSLSCYKLAVREDSMLQTLDL